MNNTLYTQIIHILAIVGLVVLIVVNKLSVDTGLAYIGVLVGIALPSPFTSNKVTYPSPQNDINQ